MSKAGNYILAAAYFAVGYYTGNPGLIQMGYMQLASPADDGGHRERAAAKRARIAARAGQVQP